MTSRQFSLPSLAGQGANVLQNSCSTPGSQTQVLQEFLEQLLMNKAADHGLHKGKFKMQSQLAT